MNDKGVSNPKNTILSILVLSNGHMKINQFYKLDNFESLKTYYIISFFFYMWYFVQATSKIIMTYEY